MERAKCPKCGSNAVVHDSFELIGPTNDSRIRGYWAWCSDCGYRPKVGGISPRLAEIAFEDKEERP